MATEQHIPYLSHTHGIWGTSHCIIHAIRNYIGRDSNAEFMHIYSHLNTHNTILDFLTVLANITRDSKFILHTNGYYMPLFIHWGILIEHVFVIKGHHVYNITGLQGSHRWLLDSTNNICKAITQEELIHTVRNATIVCILPNSRHLEMRLCCAKETDIYYNTLRNDFAQSQKLRVHDTVDDEITKNAASLAKLSIQE